MTRNESKKLTIKRMRESRSGEGITKAILEHFRNYAPKEKSIKEFAIIFNQEVPIYE